MVSISALAQSFELSQIPIKNTQNHCITEIHVVTNIHLKFHFNAVYESPNVNIIRSGCSPKNRQNSAVPDTQRSGAERWDRLYEVVCLVTSTEDVPSDTSETNHQRVNASVIKRLPSSCDKSSLDQRVASVMALEYCLILIQVIVSFTSSSDERLDISNARVSLSLSLCCCLYLFSNSKSVRYRLFDGFQ